MKLGGIIIILIIALVGLYIFAPTQFNEGKNWVTGLWSGNKTITTTTTVSSSTGNQDLKIVNNPANNVNTTNVTKSVPIILKNACGTNTTFGKPNYDGTTKAGKGCNSVYSDYDLTCIANPPKNYDGTIDSINQIANPAMTCCMADGTCQWTA